MENKDWQKNGNDFWNVVQDAVNSGNYQQLNEQVRETIDDTVDGIVSGMKGAYDGFRSGVQGSGDGHPNYQRYRNNFQNVGENLREGMQGLGHEWRQAWADAGRGSTQNFRKNFTPGYQPGVRKRQEKQLPAIYTKNPPGNVSGTVMAITGYTMTGIFGISGLASAIGMLASQSVGAGIVAAVMTALALGSLGLGIAGTRARGMARRFRNYVKQIGNRTYCSVEELSSRSGRDKESVIKDLKKMIQKKMFLQGHLDQQETCVIVTNEMYQQYLTVQQQARERQLEQQAADQKMAQLPEECQKILEEGKEYIRYIRKCNDDIPGEEISQKLSRLELIITRIFDEVGKNPSLAGDLRKFMNYYLPTTRKLIDVYREMDQETIVSENISRTKREIEATLDTINQAFENLLNSFFEEKALDISSDISVLQTMLAQEGLTGSDFDMTKK